MSSVMKQTMYLMTVSVLLLLATDSVAMEPPISRQATMVERNSATEVTIEATGIYNSNERRDRRIDRDLNENGVTEATKDARKAVVWYLLSGSTKPMLNTPEAIENFRGHETYFYHLYNIENLWITWEQSGLVNRARTSDGNGLQVTKRFRINAAMIREDLERFHIISSR